MGKRIGLVVAMGVTAAVGVAFLDVTLAKHQHAVAPRAEERTSPRGEPGTGRRSGGRRGARG